MEQGAPASPGSPTRPTGGGGPSQIKFPLWAKLGFAFGLLIGAFLALYGWYGYRQDMARAAEQDRRTLEGLAQTIAAGIRGDVFETFRSSKDMARPEYRATYRWLRAAIEANDLKWAGAIARRKGTRLYYVIDGEATGALPLGYPVFDVYPETLAALDGRVTFRADMVDEWGRWDGAFAPIRDSTGQVVGVVEADYDADRRKALQAIKTRRLAVQTGVGVLLAVLVSVVFARYVNRYLGLLTRSALDVAAGDLEQRVHIPTADEIGVLGNAFNEMVDGLKEREFIRDTFGRYVSQEVVSRVLTDPDGLKLGGELREVTILISDLRGFTALSDILGPGEMVSLLNRYFTRMGDVIMAHQGIISEFTGDGIVAFFGAPTSTPDDPLHAVVCAVQMQAELEAFAREEGRILEMGIGVATGQVVAGNIGSTRRMKYGVVGPPINLAARLESFTVGSQVLVDDPTYQAVRDRVSTGEPILVLAKGKKEPVRAWYIHEVRTEDGRALRMPEADPSPTVPVDLPATCHLLLGKKVQAKGSPARVVALAVRRLVLETTCEANVLDDLELKIEFVPGEVSDGIYGKVVSVEQREGEGARLEVRLTSVPDPVEDRMSRLLPPVPIQG